MAGWRLDLITRDHVKFVDPMILVGRTLRGRIAFAFPGHNMHQDRTLLRIAHVLQNRYQLIEIMTIDRADVIKAEFFKLRAALPQMASVFFHARGTAFPRFRQAFGKLLGDVAHVQVRLA